MDLQLFGFTQGVDYFEKPDSPTITRDSRTHVLMVKKSRAEELWNALMNAQGQTDGGLALNTSQCSMKYSAAYAEITAVFTAGDNAVPFSWGANTNTENAVYSIDTVGAEHRIEEAALYYFNWNHSLYILWEDSNTGTPGPVPSWWATAQNGKVSNPQYCWGGDEPPQSPKEGYSWRMVQPRQKKADAFLVPESVVHEHRIYRTLSEAKAAVLSAGKRRRPKETFSLNTENKYWLIVRVSVNDKDNSVDIDYQYSPTGWDKDIYNSSYPDWL